MGNAGDNTKDNTTNSKIVSDELYLYSLKKMADLNAKKNESPLTGLYGIKAFFYEANELMKNNSDKKFAVIRMDIYHFKTVNEFCGREEADKLLKYISGLFCDYEGEFCVAGHFRADIFVLCTSFDDKQELIDIVNSIKSRIDQYNIQCKVLPAFGICINNNNMDISLMCDYADLAIKKIKGKVFKTYEFYDNAMRESMLLEKKIENDVLPALKNDYIKAYVQPKVEMMEDKGIEPVPISVNVSRMHVYQEKFTENLKNMAGEYGIDPKYIPLEITESAFTKEEGSLFKKVQSLQGYGFKFSMDDFGSGYSSLGMLKSERVDEVKIDKTFVDDIATDKGKVLLGNVIRMINELGIDMIAEGVETKEQADFLKENGCMYAQGYYYYKPMPIEEFAKLLENSAR